MTEENISLNHAKLIQNLIISIRHMAIYPPKHPTVVNSIKNVYNSFSKIAEGKKSFNITVSPDNKILIDSQEVSDKSVGDLRDFIPTFRKLNIEDIIFSSETTIDEIGSFIDLCHLDAAVLKKYTDINEFFKERAITHIQAKQFSYIKVEKGKEGKVGGADHDPLERLKSKLKEFCEKKLTGQADIELFEKELFSAVGSELKANKKLAVPLKNILKKFVFHSPEPDGIVGRLKDALIAFGCPPQEVDALLDKIKDEISRGGVPGHRTVPGGGDSEKLSRENNALQDKLKDLEKELEVKAALIKQLEQQNKRVNDEKQRIDNVVHNMAEGMVVVDSSGKIVLVNAAAESLLGVTKLDVGKPIRDVVKDEHLLTLTKTIPADKDAVIEKDIELVSSNESTKRILRTSSAVVEDPNGNTVGMVTTLNDVTRQREVEKFKSEFLSLVSHELRTPLVAVDKSLSLMLDKSNDSITSENKEQFLSIAQRNIKRLTALINDLLDLAKLEARKMKLQISLGSIETLVNDTAADFKTWAGTKEINLNITIQSGMPLVKCDENKITQVLTNLMGNAIKFTPVKGTVTVNAQYLEAEKKVTVFVEDTGPGIAQEDLQKVFDKFYQAKNRAATDITGTGIGLTIVKEIIELHEGSVAVESSPGHGAKFFFSIPLEGPKEGV